MNVSPQGLLAAYQTLRNRHTGLVLATILATEGSTYRKAGARMLITPDGDCHGLLGGYDLHQAIVSRSARVFAERSVQIFDFDAASTDAGVLSMELDPDARLSILLEYVATDRPGNTLELLQTGLQHKHAVLATICESSLADCPPGAQALIVQSASMHCDVGEPYRGLLVEIADQALAGGHPVMESCISGAGSFTAFYDLITPPTQLLIIGAGPDAIPLLRLALALGWLVTIVDPRLQFTQAAALAAAHRVLTLEPEALPDAIDLESIDAAVLMTHRLDLDQRYLQRLRGNTRLQYIGLLGTERRKAKLLRALSPNPEGTGKNIYGPAGLDLGGRSPEQIALAIISEIQAVLHHRGGGPLSRAQPVPRVAAVPSVSEQDLYAIVLAAGGSRRFGGIKQLLELEGKSLLKRAIETAGNTFDNRVKLVLGIKPNKLQREVEGYDIEVVVNKDWEYGIATSLRSGIKSLPPRCQGALIIFCDQPYITAEHMRRMIDLWKNEPAKIVASAYAGTLGVPVIFPARHFPAILQLQGDTGAKVIIDSDPDNVIRIEIPEAEIDIDTQEDLLRILRK